MLCFLTAIFSFAYIYFVQSSVADIVSRENLNKKISSIVMEVSSLESEYLNIGNEVNIETAKRLGLKENFDKMNFANIESEQAKGRLSFLGNEI